ncbi:MAG: hypothetical protein ACKV0T_29290 [Planctomycetales bacterium]
MKKVVAELTPNGARWRIAREQLNRMAAAYNPPERNLQHADPDAAVRKDDRSRILVVAPGRLKSGALMLPGFRVDTAFSREEADRLLDRQAADYKGVLLDLEVPRTCDESRRGLEDEDVGRNLFSKIRSHTDIAVVVMTGNPSTENLVHALRHRAPYLVTRPKRAGLDYVLPRIVRRSKMYRAEQRDEALLHLSRSLQGVHRPTRFSTRALRSSWR